MSESCRSSEVSSQAAASSLDAEKAESGQDTDGRSGTIESEDTRQYRLVRARETLSTARDRIDCLIREIDHRLQRSSPSAGQP